MTLTEEQIDETAEYWHSLNDNDNWRLFHIAMVYAKNRGSNSVEWEDKYKAMLNEKRNLE